MRQMNHAITVKLPPETLEALHRLAAQTELTTEELIQLAVERWMENNPEPSPGVEKRWSQNVN